MIGEVQQGFHELLSAKSDAEERCTTTEAEMEELKSKYLRLNADFDNFRKRAVCSLSAHSIASIKSSIDAGERKRTVKECGKGRCDRGASAND